jgi:hypothetical protein
VSQANVEIVKRLVEAFYARDTQAALPILDRDMTFEPVFAEAKTYTGLGQFPQYRRDVDEAWGEWRSEDDRFLPSTKLVCFTYIGSSGADGAAARQWHKTLRSSGHRVKVE